MLASLLQNPRFAVLRFAFWRFSVLAFWRFSVLRFSVLRFVRFGGLRSGVSAFQRLCVLCGCVLVRFDCVLAFCVLAFLAFCVLIAFCAFRLRFSVLAF